MEKIKSLVDIADKYDVIFCDVWGVIHDGVVAYRDAIEVLLHLRNEGKKVIFITNSPRRNDTVAAQIAKLGVTDMYYDHIVTSGDATRSLIETSPRKLFYIGQDRALGIIDGLDVELVEEQEAQAILCTGLFEGLEKSLDFYNDILLRAKSRNLPFICANPDIHVWYGDELIYCAGALAKNYSLLGGNSLIAGKPHHIIYDIACRKLKQTICKSKILAIGDGLFTDIKGAINFGVDCVFIANGVEKLNYTVGSDINFEALQKFVEKHGLIPNTFMFSLK